MPAIIAITEYQSMPGRYKWAAQVGDKQFSGDVPGRGPEAAAAAAMDVAIKHGGGSYTVFGPKSVLECIPADMRSKR